MKDNTLFLLGGGLVIYYLMNSKKTKETSKIQKTEEETEKIEQSTQKQNYSFNPNSSLKGNLINSNSNGSNPNEFGLISNPSLNKPLNKPLVFNPNISLNKGNFGLKSNSIPAYNKIVIKKVATPGYFYKVSESDRAYPDPLMKIAVTAYELNNIPDNVILTYARQLNANDYNIRFQHLYSFSDDYLPYNKRIDTSSVYGTLKQQYEDSVQGSHMKGNSYPYLYIPLESEFV